MSLGRMPARVAPLLGPKPWWKSLALILVPALILLVVLFPYESASAQTRPKVTDIAFIGLPNSGDTFRQREGIRVLVTFDKDVTVDRSLLHFVGLEIGSRKGLAWYAGGIGGLVVFEYLVVDGDMDADGVSIRANAIVGTIVDATDRTTVAVLTHDAVPDDPVRKVDGTPPEPGVTVRPRTRTVPEGGTASYQVALDSQPRGSVTVSVTPAADSDPDLGATPARLTFTASNWSTGQTVTVSAADDQDGTVGTATFGHTATSTDPEYSGIEIADVTAAENDDEYAHFIPFFPSASTAVQGFARIINRSDEAGVVYIFGIDDDGERHGPARLALSELESAHFNSQDLEAGSPDKGLTHGLGDGAGMWRLELATQLRILPLAYIRTSDGFVTAMQDVAEMSTGEDGTAHYVPFFNPGSNDQQVSRLRIANSGPEDVAVTIEGIDDHGIEGDDVRFTLSGGETRSVTAQELESGGSGLSGGLGDGAGKWRLDVTADAPVEVVNFLESPTGHLANLSTSVGTIAVADPVVTPTGVESIEIDGETVEAAIDQVLVFLEEDVTRKELFDLRARAQELSIDSAFDPDLRMLQLVVDSGTDEADIIEELRARAGVSAAGPNSLVYLDAPAVLDDETGYGRYLERSGGRPFPDLDVNPLAVPLPNTVSFGGDYWIDTINAASAWLALSRETLHDNTIGVVDTGLPRTQDVLSEARVSRFDETGNPLGDDDTPGETHGLWVAGLAAGYGNGPTRRGVNPHSALVFVDVERARTSFLGGLGCKIGVLNCTFVTNVVQGIKTAINQGAQVVNVSWGDGSECSDRQSSRLSSRRSFRLDKVGAMHYAREKDALVVWSSGDSCENRPIPAVSSERPCSIRRRRLSHLRGRGEPGVPGVEGAGNSRRADRDAMVENGMASTGTDGAGVHRGG